MFKLYNFFRSGTSHRLRIALNLKGLSAEYIPVDLRTLAHLSDDYKTLHPQGLVPALQRDDGRVMIQTPAIIEWLEERYPTPALLPANADQRAQVRALAALIGCDVHPLNNRRVLEYLRKSLGCDEAAVNQWCHTWISTGFDALETLLQADTTRGAYCVGNTPTLADVYLVPQVESARRFNMDVTAWPAIQAVDAACAQLDAFRHAAPSQQIDAR
jgi:maleylpyruvate isomerase